MFWHFARVALISAGVLGSAAAQAQHVPYVIGAFPTPVYRGGPVAQHQAMIRDEFPPGACAAGLFMSSDTSVLGVPGIRVRPDAQFWFHHGSPTGDGNPWHIDRGATESVLGALPARLAKELRATLASAETTEWRVYYTGLDLIGRFKYRAC